MPSMLKNHFREIEIRVVSEIAWASGSPVVNLIKALVEKQKQLMNAGSDDDEATEASMLEESIIMQPH